MRLKEYPLLADENIQPEVIDGLRAQGLDVLSVGESNLSGSDDLALIRLAKDGGRVVVTHDSDFGTLAFTTKEPYVGIVYLRPGHIRPAFTLASLQTLLNQEIELSEPFIIVARRIGDRLRVRVRRT